MKARIKATLIAIGDLEPDDLDAPIGRAGIGRAGIGRAILLKGLTDDDVRAFAPLIGEGVCELLVERVPHTVASAGKMAGEAVEGFADAVSRAEVRERVGIASRDTVRERVRVLNAYRDDLRTLAAGDQPVLATAMLDVIDNVIVLIAAGKR
jgi:hypothetical protein